MAPVMSLCREPVSLRPPKPAASLAPRQVHDPGTHRPPDRRTHYGACGHIKLAARGKHSNGRAIQGCPSRAEQPFVRSDHRTRTDCPSALATVTLGSPVSNTAHAPGGNILRCDRIESSMTFTLRLSYSELRTASRHPASARHRDTFHVFHRLHCDQGVGEGSARPHLRRHPDRLHDFLFRRAFA